MTSALPPGRIRERLDDFVVEEIPAYAPSGEGSHVFVRFTKTGLTTVDAVRAIARALSCETREAGHAGLKDKRAVTTQTISLQAPRGVTSADLARRAGELSLEGITVHEATPHGHKIKPGHLTGNRFEIVVRDVPVVRLAEVTAAFERVRREGVPNAFGPQRFGREGDNAARALAWLSGKERGPREPRMQRFLWSSLQSAVYNRVLDARVEDGTWATPVEGDLLKLRSSGGLFVCTDVQTDRARAETGEVSPTGPIVGARMAWPRGVPADLERRLVDETLGEGFDLDRTRRLGEGSRRALRLWVGELRWEIVQDDSGNAPACIRVYFVLPKGAYATTVLAAGVAIEEPRLHGGAPSAASGGEEGD
ncbi:MAG: tRNA pseudouridine(13) synthase TruD [Polyangiaceae bacterium]